MTDVVLRAPFAGWVTPLDEVPDPVFAERMMGDGIAVDPVEPVLRAPADATVIAIPDTAHAVTLRLANGAELLIHIGLETVALGGVGFRAVSSAGAKVKAGDPLIEIDLAEVARRARSLVTPIVVATEGFAIELDGPSRRVACGEPIARISGSRTEVASRSHETHERPVRIAAVHGLHARPAARIAALLRTFEAEVSIGLGHGTVNARSTVAMLGLGVKHGDELRVVGRGPDSKAAVDAVVGLIEGGLGETAKTVPCLPAVRSGPVCASPGLAIGEVIQLGLTDLPAPHDGVGIAEELEQLKRALDAVARSLVETNLVAAELAAAHRMLLQDPDLLARANREIEQGRSAAFAWRSACEAARDAILATGDLLLMERAADLADLERQVIAVLVGDDAPAVPDLPSQSILIAPDLLPSQLLALDKTRLVGICTSEGGPTSHVAILAASAAIPMLVTAGPAVLEIAKGTTVILDADHGRIETDPPPKRLQEMQKRLADQRMKRAAEARDAKELCFTADGVRIEVFANLGSVADAQSAVAAGAEGCGLLRTEFLFLDRTTPPSKEDQEQIYSEIAKALGNRPLVVRTLDIGADKKVPYVAIGPEENPALGLRGIRLSFARPDLLVTQLEAIAAAVPAEQCRIMLPMVTDADELRQVRRLLDGIVGARLALGAMVETPAAALMADSIAAEADFLSIGTNDLTQYVLAADRGNAALAARMDALHPAVLRLIRRTTEGGREHDRWTGVCGGLASEALAAPILIGLGVTELSVAPAAVPAIKATVRRLRLDDCRALAERACTSASPSEVRAIASEALG
jgi:phosphoenolpyruvate-protein phosphotransferase